jgi:hypothetical protein
MTVRTNDIALCDLIKQSRHADPTCNARDLELLRARIPMIEIHHVGRVPLAAVDAWHLAELSYECDLLRHPFPRSGEKLVAVGFVVRPSILPSVSISATITTHPDI